MSRGAATAIDNVFNQIDTDGNSVISYAEFNNFCKLHGVTDEVVSCVFLKMIVFSLYHEIYLYTRHCSYIYSLVFMEYSFFSTSFWNTHVFQKCCFELP